MKVWHWIGWLVLCALAGLTSAKDPPTSARSKKAVARVRPPLEAALTKEGLAWGAPVLLRIFKREHVLEVWLEKNGTYVLFRTYAICDYSGVLGPKQREGDLQTPEGYYAVHAGLMNPWSSYHLSFNVGYPNRYDRKLKRTGGLIMVHGNCVSIGCVAMTDPIIEEIYALVEAALRAGQQQVPVHMYPFRLSPENLAQQQDSPWHDFWVNLAEGDRYFRQHGRPAVVGVAKGRYTFSD